MNLLSRIALLALVLCQVYSLYTNDDDVVILTEDNFDQKVLNCGALWIVEFYAPWCGHCKNLAPEYIKAAKALKGVVYLGAVDSTVQKNLANKYGVKSYPTIKVFGANKESPSAYTGGRTFQSIVNFSMDEVKKRVESQSVESEGKTQQTQETDSKRETNVIELTDDNFDERVLKSEKPFLVEFFAPWCGHCKKLAPEWEVAANRLKGKVNVGALDATVHKEKSKEYEIKGYPTIKMFHNGMVEDYTAERTSIEIFKFAVKKALVPKNQNEKEEKEEEEEVKVETDVIELTDENFEEEVLKSGEAFFVEFFAPWCGHCKKLAPEWELAATELKGKVRVGAMDATVNAVKPKEYEVRGYPTIKFFHNGNVEDYKLGRSAKDITNFALNKISSSKTEKVEPEAEIETDVIKLTDENFEEEVLKSGEPFLVEFFAPWCGHCKRLAPEWEIAATQLKGKVKVGALDATVNKLKPTEYEVRGYPTIKYFHDGNVEDYKMGRNADAITTFAISKISVLDDSDEDKKEL